MSRVSTAATVTLGAAGRVKLGLRAPVQRSDPLLGRASVIRLIRGWR